MKNRKFRLLQLFADSEEGGAVVEKEGTAPGAQEGAELEPANISQSFDDFLSNGGQAEFDRRVNKAVQTAVANAQKKWQTITDSKVSEAEKLSQMTGEEKERYRADKAEQELAELRQEIALGEMAKPARKILSDEQITVPDDIIMNLICDDVEKTKASVEGFAKMFKDAVQAAVKEELRGNVPKGVNGSPKPITRKQILADLNTSYVVIYHGPMDEYVTRVELFKYILCCYLSIYPHK